MKAYFTIKLWLEFIIPALIIVLVFIQACISDFKFNKKITYLSSKGYERYLDRVNGLNSEAYYGWKTEDKRVLESDLRHMTIKEVKEKY